MDFVLLLRAVFALAVTLGLIGLAAVVMRKYGPETIARMSMLKRERRLTLIESLPLDPARRLVLVSLDGRERLILLGEGQLLIDTALQETGRTKRPARKTVEPAA
ncbi:flagellar protein FliO/FliZ [Caulobacter ginsengisoli]|uniref:Flagellar protein FliO/FliZ n=1 Tax=Caulobacter ginsengisoli TaxID=400775 RepID=A0ABU0IK41_9CAUL|nr:flagellar biosynthetic protein FliO [Caulobacter ginsengisoli]MDQ0462378.1 flagellar protein FliO/FliZ [Caulobacter ginsengisoli]